jgi:uncharacterized protein YodC (DUF2158 family)
MPLMVGNIVVLNSGSPPMTVKAITHAGQVLCQWIDSGGVLHVGQAPFVGTRGLVLVR